MGLAARVREGSRSIELAEFEPSNLGPEDALVSIESSMITRYLASLIDGSGGFETPPKPFTPGSEAIGTVEAVGTDVNGVELGTPVYCDPYIEDVVDGERVGSAFIGCFPISGMGDRKLAQYPDGSLSTHMRIPAACLTDVSPALRVASKEVLTRLGWFGTALAAFDKAGFRAGDRVAVTGAGGVLGSSAVLLGLALGASKVYAVGRDALKMERLLDLDTRIEVTTDAPPPDSVDLVVSCASGGTSESNAALLKSLRRFGTFVITASLDPPPLAAGLVLNDLTIRGSLWFPRDVPGRLVCMIAAGQLRLDRIATQVFTLENVADALVAAEQGDGALFHVVVNPSDR